MLPVQDIGSGVQITTSQIVGVPPRKVGVSDPVVLWIRSDLISWSYVVIPPPGIPGLGFVRSGVIHGGSDVGKCEGKSQSRKPVFLLPSL
jgi:hypothetical protein